MLTDEWLEKVCLLRRDREDVKRWVRMVTETVIARYPTVDIYPVYIRRKQHRALCFGCKSGAKASHVAFGLTVLPGAVRLGPKRKSPLFKRLSAENRTDLIVEDHRKLADRVAVDDWLSVLEEALGEQFFVAIQGNSRRPEDYPESDGDDGEEEDDFEEGVTMAENNESAVMRSSLNQILYGPPGTGKTYNTINQALSILAPDVLVQNSGDDPDSRRRLKTEFDRFVSAERVRFVTFHQSFSYEDFVEGLRADSDTETGQVKYSVESGVFKRICDDARTRPASDLGVRANPAIWKISIAGTGASPTKSYCLANGEARIGWGETGDLRGDFEQNAYYQSLGGGDKGTLSYFAEQMVVGDILLCIHSAEQIGSIGVVTSDYRYEEQVPAGVLGDYQHVRSVRWLYRDINLSILPLNDERQFTLKTVYAMSRFTWADLLSYLQQQGVKPVESVTVAGADSEPYVLIIDEINRGNVSRIFGELITLIEESKREGADEALSVKLPYSKKPFSVPKNVYLIGTMNTADRSLAGLDIALRRRFVFREMPPQPELLDGVMVEGVNIRRLLEVMNERIEALLDRDHCLGHAYFMPLKTDRSLARLELIFRNQILPLLQEYFFEDWQRIAWVLNDHRKADADCFVVKRKTDLAALFGDQVAGRGEIWQVNEGALSRASSYAGVIHAQKPASTPDTPHAALDEELESEAQEA